MVCRIGHIMDIEIAFGIVAAAIGAGVLLRLAWNGAARLRLRWSLRKMRFCPHCGVVLVAGDTCLRCARPRGAAGVCRPGGAGEDSPSPN